MEVSSRFVTSMATSSAMDIPENKSNMKLAPTEDEAKGVQVNREPQTKKSLQETLLFNRNNKKTLKILYNFSSSILFYLKCM